MSRLFTVLAAGIFLMTAVHTSAAAPLGAPKASAAQTKQADDLAAKVKAKIDSDPELKSHSITVTASAGTVTLEGEAPTVVARAKAGELARDTQGVKKVNNKMKIAKAE